MKVTGLAEILWVDGRPVRWEQAERAADELERAAHRIRQEIDRRRTRWLQLHDGKRQPPGGCPLSCSGRHR